MTRIAGVRLTAVNTPRRSGLECGHVVVELDTDVDGLVGVGEMSDFQHLPRFHVDVAELERTLAGLLVGLDPRRLNEVQRRLEESFPQAGTLYDKGSVIKCGVDIAVWDLLGKLQGCAVADLLGGRVRDSLPVAYPVFRQQRERDVEANLEVVAERLAAGFSRFRVYVGRRLDLDEAFLRRARDRFGDRISIKSLDFSNLLEARDACAFVARTHDVGYELVEAPARSGDAAGLAHARERLPVPVSEHVYSASWALELVAARAVDVLNVGLFAIGGITPARRLLAIAEAADLRCLVGTTQELSIGTAAAAHLGVSAPAVTVPSDPVGPLLYTADVVATPVRYRDGDLLLPEGPGLGVQLDHERLAEVAGPLRWPVDDITGVVDRVGVPG
ncbi:mandelate racemase/muconate lactonizing enzyme family protein [Desertihabitans aurantiacus]|uniref:mandelate racemase/muconate lactonizing enzyme family protein n=1 Tax=Desertihabitans aurantiacus TaxID=2282477 RepID=UPI000DF8532A|nr:enolase C-terminal domain-like protein [Desertihabitans aurantiacus]